MINKEDGRAKAREDWAAGQAFVMVGDELPRGGPRLDDSRPFYRASLAGVDWAEDFCRDYNAEIEALIARDGIPDWAPGKRRPSDAECLALLEAGEPAGDLGEARALLQRVLDEWAWATREPPKVVFDAARSVVVIGRTITSSGEVWVDLLDVRGGEYMCHLELKPG